MARKSDNTCLNALADAVEFNEGSSSFRASGGISSLKQSATTVETTAKPIPATALTNRRTILVYNNGSEIVHLGNNTVTTTNGYPLAPGDEKAFDITDDAVLYGRTASGTANIRVLEGA